MNKIDLVRLADLLFPDVEALPEDMEQTYPPRNLSEGALVTRIGPSPTGFVHLGNLYNAIIAERIAHQSGGAFYLRIEDTDDKRKVDGAVEIIISAMKRFGIFFDEGATNDGGRGEYGPYVQSQRKSIYHVFAKQLVLMGKAYPCFCNEEDLQKTRDAQTEAKETTGYYGKYAPCRDLVIASVEEKIHNGEPWVLRFRADVSDDYIHVNDAIRGTLSMPKNYMDFVLLKSNGIPTYHFAHAVDDHLMRTTHVTRGEEWIPSLPIHVDLFNAFGWEIPLYCHTATLMKMDGTSKRKLSKRKDPELSLSYYMEEGYCADAVWEYMLTILNSNYEEWREKNPTLPYSEFPFSLSNMSSAGALFDLEKLISVSKNVIAAKTADQIYDEWLSWCKEYNKDFAELLTKYEDRAKAALALGKSGNKVRKDIFSWKQACEYMSFYFDETFEIKDTLSNEAILADKKVFLEKYIAGLDFSDDSQKWFEKVKEITAELGYALRPKDFQKEPEKYKGSIVDTTNLLRVALTGMTNAPDIWSVSQVLGETIVRERLQRALAE